MNNNQNHQLDISKIAYFLELLQIDFEKKRALTSEEEHALINDFFLAWKYRRPDVRELLDLRTKILEKSQLVDLHNSHQALDVVGTGGDGCQTFNISTAVMIVCRSLGIPMIKHGGKAVSSVSGSSDILTDLGIQHRIDNSIRDWDTQKLAFLWAPQYHPIMKLVGPWREKIKQKTIFNFMGPLLHPAKNSLQSKLLGVSSEAYILPYALALKELNFNGMVVYGGMDELGTHTLNHVAYVTGREMVVVIEEFRAENVGATIFSLEEIQVSSKIEAKQMFFDALNNQNKAAVEVIALNVAAALQCYGLLPMAMPEHRQRNRFNHSWITGMNMAKKVIENGTALNTLKQWQHLYQK